MNLQYLRINDDNFLIKNSPNPDTGAVISNKDIITYWNYRYISKNKIVLLAHNYGAGINFFNIKIGDSIFLIDNNQDICYTVTDIRKFWATKPNSIYSNFVEEKTSNIISNHDLFYDIYTGIENQLVLQTCIEKDGNNKAGRLFIICSK